MSVTIDAFWRWRDEFDTQHRTLLLSQESTEGETLLDHQVNKMANVDKSRSA